MPNTNELAELLASDLAALCDKHGLSAFVETSKDGVQYHLIPQQVALAHILDSWRPPARAH